jgi:hypothetical protein
MNGDAIYHPIHEYQDTLQNIYLGDFKESPQFQSYCQEHDQTDISFSIFREGALKCRCIKEPTMRVCVDEIETGFAEMVNNLKEMSRRRRVSCECNFCQSEMQRKVELGEGN